MLNKKIKKMVIGVYFKYFFLCLSVKYSVFLHKKDYIQKWGHAAPIHFHGHTFMLQ